MKSPGRIGQKLYTETSRDVGKENHSEKIVSKMPVFLIIVYLAVISGCQVVDVDRVENALQSIPIELPPRDPFADFYSVPSSLSDIDNTRDCGGLVKKSHSDILVDDLQWFTTVYPEKEGWAARKVAEKYFYNGEPRRAAAFLEKANVWKKYHSDKLGNSVFLSTFYAAYGEIEKAKRSYGRGNSHISTHPSKTCKNRDKYWRKRAAAYLKLAEAKTVEALDYISMARIALTKYREPKGENCGRLNESWRDSELDFLFAKAHFQLGLLNKAEAFATRTYKKSSSSVFYRGALHILGQIKLQQGRYQDALSFFLIVKEIQNNFCVPRAAVERAEVNRDLALTLVALNDFQSANTIFQEMQVDLEGESELWDNLFASSLERGIILREIGQVKEAQTLFSDAVSRHTRLFGANHSNTAEARMMLALSDTKMPIDETTESLRELLLKKQQMSHFLVSDGASHSIRTKWIVEQYLSLVFSNDPNQEIIGKAFEISEVLRSGSVQYALVQSALRRLAPSEEARQLLRKQQNLQRKMEVLRQKLNEAIDYGWVGSATVNDLRDDISKTETVITSLSNQARILIPEYDSVTGVNSFNLKQFVNVLEPDEAVVAVSSGRQQSYIWVITGDGKISGISNPIAQQDWAKSVERLRKSVQPSNGSLNSLFDFDTETAHDLYLDLLQPMQSHWSSANHLIFITDNALSSLPMGMLLREPVTHISHDGVILSGYNKLPWLIRTHSISLSPSATTLILLRQGNTFDKEKLPFLGVGDPVFDPEEHQQVELVAKTDSVRGEIALRSISTTRGLSTAKLNDLSRLPDTAEEITAIAKVLGADKKRDVFLGKNATEAKLRQMNQENRLRDYRVLSFATHGLIPGDLDGLMSPALALSSPGERVQGDWDDGLLKAEEIIDFDFDAEWAILSACNTASSEILSNEVFSGLGRAFFYAGARSLLLSNWPVYSDSTRLLMVSLFENEDAAPNRAEALQRATLEVMENGVYDKGGSSEFSYAHPLFWAPFTLVGDGGK